MIMRICTKILWKLSDDAVGHVETFGDYYNKVPKHLKKVTFWTDEFHHYPKEYRKEIISWLDRD